MVTLNMESRNPMGRVYAENRSKTQKLLGVKGLTYRPHFTRPGKGHSYVKMTGGGGGIRISCDGRGSNGFLLLRGNNS